MQLLIEILVGVLLAIGFLFLVTRTRSYAKQKRIFAVGLVVAALIYVVFGLFSGSTGWLITELAGVLIFATFAWLGLRQSGWFLALGWALHPLWDAGLHGWSTPFVPHWYIGGCIGFDWLVAVYIAYRERAHSSKTLPSQEPGGSRSNVKALKIIVLLGCVIVGSHAVGKAQVDSKVSSLGQDFSSSTARVNGTTLHYVRGGSGPAVILVHGFPQDWYEFHPVMSRLSKKFTVVAVDLRGIGGSTATPAGYEAANMAKDIHELVQQLKLERVYVAGHDIGGMVAYAFARSYPNTTRGLMIFDVPLPGLKPWDEVKDKLWHLGFHQTPELPEKLIAGRQELYFRDFFNRSGANANAIPDADVAHYANSYASPEQLRAGMEMYRAFPANGQFNQAQRDKVSFPVVLVAGEKSFAILMPKLAEDLRAHGCDNVSVEVIKNSGHYVVDEQPDAVAALIERYASSAV